VAGLTRDARGVGAVAPISRSAVLAGSYPVHNRGFLTGGTRGTTAPRLEHDRLVGTAAGEKVLREKNRPGARSAPVRRTWPAGRDALFAPIIPSLLPEMAG
jgi:hypothetical protein